MNALTQSLLACVNGVLGTVPDVEKPKFMNALNLIINGVTLFAQIQMNELTLIPEPRHPRIEFELANLRFFSDRFDRMVQEKYPTLHNSVSLTNLSSIEHESENGDGAGALPGANLDQAFLSGRRQGGRRRFRKTRKARSVS